MNPHNRANPIAPASGIWSPSAASPKTFELTQHGQVRGKLLERDPALPEGARGYEFEAAPAHLSGQRPRQREDRPERGAEGEDGTVFPAHVAAQRAELGPEQRGVAEEVDHRGGQAADEVVHLETRGRGREHGPDRGTQHKRQPTEDPRGDEECEARVADRLAIDAAEAVQAPAKRDRLELAERCAAGVS